MFYGYYNYSWLMLLSKLNEKVSYNLINNNPNNYDENLLNVNNNSNEIKIEMDDIKRNSNNICQICYEKKYLMIEKFSVDMPRETWYVSYSCIIFL